MSIVDYFWIAVGLMLVLDIAIMLVYCFIQEKIERRMEKRKIGVPAEKKEKAYEETAHQESLVKRIYFWGQSYLAGLTRYNLILVGKIPSYFIRKILYKFVFRMKISMKTTIGGGCEIRSPWNISIGKSTIMTGCLLDGRSKIQIGDNVVFGSFVHVWTMEHDMDDPYFRTLEHNKQPVIIENRAWICSDSTILPGVHIGEGAVVASRACVTKDCEPFTVYGGVPAKKIKDRNRNLKYELSGKPSYRFY